jgi:hypothetical protein
MAAMPNLPDATHVESFLVRRLPSLDALLIDCWHEIYEPVSAKVASAPYLSL